ncbi:HAAS signaling domain-containing protein [Cellulomonas sp. P22]|uniref:HAAS signaling domain-containing protein n=1 Tax=Cellulomonas sp. P22 TaxID=3373189 RepID=UPI00379B816B
MSSTSTGPGVIADVHAYATAVRRHLVGLTPEQVEDLTDGLEADLGEALADAPGTDDLVGRFGEPRAYASELRAAAGLPDGGAAPARRRSFWRWLTLPIRSAYEACVEGLDVLRAQPWWPPVGELLTVLLPVAWVLRGWMAYQLAYWITAGLAPSNRMPWVPFGNPLLLLIMLAMMVVSVQWGRGLWLPRGRLRRLPTIATIGALLIALPVMGTLAARNDRVEHHYDTVTEYVPAPEADGVVVGGMAVSNLYVYDAEGNPLDDVQIYDDRGRPVETIGQNKFGFWNLYDIDDPWQFTSVQDEDGRTRWNVYPLRGAPVSDYSDGRTEDGRPTPNAGVSVRTPPRPFAKAPAISTAEGQDSTPDPTPDPTDGATDASSAEPTATATPGAVTPTP